MRRVGSDFSTRAKKVVMLQPCSSDVYSSSGWYMVMRTGSHDHSVSNCSSNNNNNNNNKEKMAPDGVRVRVGGAGAKETHQPIRSLALEANERHQTKSGSAGTKEQVRLPLIGRRYRFSQSRAAKDKSRPMSNLRTREKGTSTKSSNSSPKSVT